MSSPLLQLADVHQRYRTRSSGGGVRGRATVHALNGVDLDIQRGETVGVVGESGCGKSTLARLMVGLEQPSQGTIRWNGQDVATLDRSSRRAFHRAVQLVFQNPHASLNPRRNVKDSVAEGIITHELVPADGIEHRVCELLEQVGLSREYLHRYPHELSGGQLQRVGIARALAVEPELLVCDEPVSALDISIQAQVLNLLNRLKSELDLGIVFIAHDLDVVQHMADRIQTMYLGKIVEQGECEDVYERSGHPYTRALLSAIPRRLQAGEQRDRVVLKGDPPSPVELPGGCAFHTRCYAAEAICATESPALGSFDAAAERTAGPHRAACHFAAAISRSDVGSVRVAGTH
jgi:oligopeptide/dipeptide ABC transporter ATP-binding protein